MKKKQILVACLPAVITLLVIVMNVLTESKVSTLYRNAVSALDAQDYSAMNDSLSQIYPNEAQNRRAGSRCDFSSVPLPK